MGFIEPFAFVFAGLFGVLVFLYLWERWRRRVAVPSLLLWEAVHEDTIRARRFHPDLLFILQLLLLACLILGLARPYIRRPNGMQAGGRHIFVLDTSASMQAREGRSSRFEQAREQARARLTGLQDGDEVMLVTVAPAPAVQVGFTRDHEAVEKALQQAVPTDTGGDVALALAFVDTVRQRSDLPTEVDVFTDIPRSQLPEPLRDQATVFQVGESDDNIGIEALQIFQGRFQDFRRARAYVLVQNFAHREGHGFLTVRLEDQVVNRSGFTIAPRESKGFLIHNFPGPGRVVAQLEVTDALAADNVAYGYIRPVTPTHVLAVSSASPLVDDLRELAAATPGLEVAVVAPEALNAAQLAHADIAIFHRVVPNPAPAVNALYIYPPGENGLFPASGDAQNIEVLDWNDRHPVLQSLQPLAALPLQRARMMAAPPWSQVLLWSRTIDREFPLAFAGERDGHRVACIAFDLEAERLLSSDNLNIFLFFMNLLDWLSARADAVHVVRTGEVQALDALPPGPLDARDPRGITSTLPATQRTLQPLFAGEYRIGVDGTSRRLLANFFNPTESDIGRASREAPIFHEAARLVRDTPEAPHNEYGAWLYYAAAALLLLEWVVARRIAT